LIGWKVLHGMRNALLEGAGLARRRLWLVPFVLAGLVLNPTTGHSDAPERLVVVNSASWTPYSFLDAGGEPRGLLIDLWRLFGERNAVEIVFRLVDWSDTFELIKRGEADVHGGLTVSKARETSLDFSRELLRVRTLVFVPSDAVDDDLAEIGQEPVGVVAAAYEQRFIETHFPYVRLRTYPNSEVMVKAAIAGEVHAFVADDPSGYYRLLLADAMDRYRGAHALYTSGIHAAVKKGDDELLAFIDAGFAKITDAEVQSVHDRWLIPAKPIPSWLMPAALSTCVILIVLALGIHYLALRRTVSRRTVDLNTSIQKLEIANRELDRLASTDPLTGVANRHTFYERAALETERAKRYRRPLSIALFDLDRFKQINDRYGHLAGDAVLSEFARKVGAGLRETDLFARFGGDEFVALLPETRRSEAASVARRILDDLRDHRFDYEGRILPVSFSAGVAEFEGEGSVDAWIRRADSGLYQSKREGRAMVTESLVQSEAPAFEPRA
jgi:diguanylate cyclase (GGDEF)-like protein